MEQMEQSPILSMSIERKVRDHKYISAQQFLGNNQAPDQLPWCYTCGKRKELHIE